MIYYAVVHKSVVNLVSAQMDGSSVNHRQVVCKDPSATQSVSMILQVISPRMLVFNCCCDRVNFFKLLHVAHNISYVI